MPPAIGRATTKKDRKMIVKAKISNKAIHAEGTYDSIVGSVKGKPNDTEPKKVILGFKIKDHEAEIYKEVAFSFEEDSPLRKDVESILGRQFTKTEATDGFDLNSLLGKRCRVVVMHKSGAGGRAVAVVTLVLPPTAQ
jgi:hypothetical protein